MKRLLLNKLLIVGLILAISVIAVASDLIDSEVDWDKGVIRVVGIGAPPEGKSQAIGKVMAQRSAKADAYRNGVAYLEGVRVDSRTLVKEAVVESDEISNQISGLIQNGRFVEIKYGLDGICTVVLEIPLGVEGGLAGIFYQTMEKTQPTSVEIQPVEQVEVPETELVKETQVTEPMVKPQPEEQTPNKVLVEGAKPYTSIIVDARGLGIEPALYPQIFDSEGHLLYGATSTNFVQGYPTMVAYARTLEKAYELERAGEHPLVIQAISAIRTETKNPTDLVLDSLNTKVFKKIDGETKATARRAIIFIL